MRSGSPRELVQRLREGYWFVTLHLPINGRTQARPQPVHRLVLLAHKGAAPAAGHMARHLNGDSADSRASNLEWGTAKDNAQDAVRHGTIGPGMRAHRRRLNEEQVREIRQRIQAGEVGSALALEFGVSAAYPMQLAQGKCWASLAA